MLAGSVVVNYVNARNPTGSEGQSMGFDTTDLDGMNQPPKLPQPPRLSQYEFIEPGSLDLDVPVGPKDLVNDNADIAENTPPLEAIPFDAFSNPNFNELKPGDPLFDEENQRALGDLDSLRR